MNGFYLPEPFLVPAEDGCETAGGCGHEVYQGELLVEWLDGRKYIELCEECFQDRLQEMTAEELAGALGYVSRTVDVKTREHRKEG